MKNNTAKLKIFIAVSIVLLGILYWLSRICLFDSSACGDSNPPVAIDCTWSLEMQKSCQLDFALYGIPSVLVLSYIISLIAYKVIYRNKKK